MRVRDVQILLAVAELRSFTKAADKLCLTQPAISQSVKRMEEDFGSPIFIRTKGGLHVSEAGARAIGVLRRISDIYLCDFKHQRPPSYLKIGLASLLHGMNITPFLQRLYRDGASLVEVEIAPSEVLAGRTDLDVRILASGLVEGTHPSLQMASCWIGADTGVEIRFKTDYEVWASAGASLLRPAQGPGKVMEVRDFALAYQMATAGVGVTPCVVFDEVLASKALGYLPALPSVGFDILARERDLLDLVTVALRARAPKVRARGLPGLPTPAAPPPVPAWPKAPLPVPFLPGNPTPPAP